MSDNALDFSHLSSHVSNWFARSKNSWIPATKDCMASDTREVCFKRGFLHAAISIFAAMTVHSVLLAWQHSAPLCCPTVHAQYLRACTDKMLQQ